jgi:hypothetical protein
MDLSPVSRWVHPSVGSGRTRIELCGQLAVEIPAVRRDELPAKRLAKLRYGSVDICGNAESARKAPRPAR